eukprot:scaffold107488_cov30-Tisochrysis_lutea.AAC.2
METRDSAWASAPPAERAATSCAPGDWRAAGASMRAQQRSGRAQKGEDVGGWAAAALHGRCEQHLSLGLALRLSLGNHV